jgi:hypothetical protein
MTFVTSPLVPGGSALRTGELRGINLHKLSKRWLSIAVATGALAAGSFTFLPAAAQARDASAQSGTQADFVTAAEEFHVPLSVLMGVAHEQSGWQQHPGYSSNGGWGLMNLTDVTAKMVEGGAAGAAGRADLTSFTQHPELHTLRDAAKLTGLSAERLQHHRGDNIRGGAALLASYQKELTGGTSQNPDEWAAAVAKYSGLPSETAAKSYVDDVFATIKSGARQTAPDGPVTMPADPAVRPATSQLGKLGLRESVADPRAECPDGVDCAFVQAGSSGLQVSNRPANGIKITQIIIHTTESPYDSAIKTFQAGGASAQYVMRSSDGAVTQMVANKDIAFGDGNYDSNLHSIQIEHEGFSALGADWYTDVTYRQTAKLVKYLARTYDIPLDRQHILGHDNVPGPATKYLADMHWDPGNGWNWTRFMRMLDAPFDDRTRGVGAVGSAVTIAPGFKRNLQTFTVCPSDDPTGSTPACRQVTEPSSSLFVRQAPSDDAPLILDTNVHPASASGTDRVNDWSTTVQAGQRFVVAEVRADWTAIWFDGQKGWIHNPHGRNTLPAKGVRILTAAAATAVPVYGTAYPERAEYPAGLSPSTQAPLKNATTAPDYEIPVGQAYVADQPPVRSADYFTSGAVVIGAAEYYTVQFNHRYVLVNAADVTATETR